MSPIEARLKEAIGVFQVELWKVLNGQEPATFLSSVAEFRREVEAAAMAGVEHWTVWQMVAQWSVEPYDRIHCFSRALAAMDALPANQRHPSESFFRADFLANIAEAHQKQGRTDLARKFYEEALPLARASSDQHGNAVAAGTGPASLEGRIAGALLLLDGEE
jgi:tetratricopeptide (TPR) repeat protein